MPHNNQRLFTSLVELTDDAVFILSVHDNDSRFIMEYVNAAYLRRFNVSHESLIGKTLEEFLSEEKQPAVRERFVRCAKEKKALRYEENILLGSETFTSLSETIPVPDDDGNTQFIIGISKDISEMKKQRDLLSGSENTLQAIINSSENIIVFLDPGLRIIYVNDAAQRHAHKLFNKPYQLGDYILSYLTETEKQKSIEHIDFLLSGNKKSFVFEHELTYPDGEEAWFVRRYYPAFDHTGEYLGVVISSINTIERKRQQRKIEQHLQTLREIAMIQSHDIRRPVANIIGLTDLIDLTKAPAENEEILAHLKKSVRELDEQIKRIIEKTKNEGL
ncbi:PAS domain-containing sensor histidine kinase [Sediminibacterium ginsengisoli]|uniref:histidine kinase n=1 Tax=Sediminibacterium ginsengisoli TaxID=413434 RepID=A0A1T4ME73_9BACT|nr:PAS domain-containing protein [Sediminibacterium ginsengisoli]SJZ65181.1 PAS domain S-box-containing protein [Sediminibacterium ginsengisoli]